MKKKILVKTVEQRKVGNRWVDDNVWADRYITLDQFKESYVKECWENEVRSGEKYTSLGYFHTQTIVNSDKEHRTVRNFIFPLMDGYVDEAKELDETDEAEHDRYLHDCFIESGFNGTFSEWLDIESDMNL